MKFGMLLFLLVCLALPAQAQWEWEESKEDTAVAVEPTIELTAPDSMEAETPAITADTAVSEEAEIIHPVTLEDLKAYIASCTAETKEIVGYYLNGEPIYETKQTKTEPTFLGFVEWLEKKEGK